jgi:nitroreductase
VRRQLLDLMEVAEALKRRISVRAFTPESVARDIVEAILDEARWSASGGNLQPWRVTVVAGEARRRVIDAVQAKLAKDPFTDENDFPVYPPKLWEPYRTRRHELGEQMYALLGIEREDKAGRLAWLMRNYDFFGAPVGLFFSIDDRMNPNQWAHLGMFMMSIMLAAEARGLSTCAQEAWTMHRNTVAAALGVEPPFQVYCGMALGFRDEGAAVNRLRSQRAAVEDFTEFKGF